MNQQVLVVGNPDPVHVGHHLVEAANSLQIGCRLLDVRQASSGNRWLNRFFWHLLDRRPPFISRFNADLLSLAAQCSPTHVLTTGISPVVESTLRQLAAQGIRTLNFLTDDPWNPSHRAMWFRRALTHYQSVFSPRHANLGDLRNLGCERVSYLPFGYSESSHFVAADSPSGKSPTVPAGDVLFAGGADADRLEYIRALIDAGIRPILFGNSWNRIPWAAPFYHGFISIEDQRYLVSRVPSCLVLVRRANRDGHSMRSYEIPAMGGCMITEDTPDHRSMFGEDGVSTRYFTTTDELVIQTRRLLDNPALRVELAAESRRRITAGRNRYADRLESMLASGD